MINLEKLPDEIGVYKRKTLVSWTNTTKNGYVAIINKGRNEIVFGCYIPAGCTILKKKVSSNEEIIDLLNKICDPAQFKKLNKN